MALMVLTLGLACRQDEKSSKDQDFAKAISELNQHWVEQGERPLADLVLRLASQPGSISERRAEILPSLDSLTALNQQALDATQGLQQPPGPAQACHEAQLGRLQQEHAWLIDLRGTIAESQDASAIAKLRTWPSDIGPTIARADEACSAFVKGLG